MITTCGANSADELDRAGEVHFQAVMKCPHGLKLEQSLFHPLLQVDPDRAHVAHDLAGRFLEGNVEASLAAPAGGFGKSRRHARLARARGARKQNAAPAIESFAAEHGVESLDAGRDALVETPCVPCCTEVIGQIEMPSFSMRNGYSFVPCVVPRYLTTRMRRVVT